jgi:replicative DNA helicase
VSIRETEFIHPTAESTVLYAMYTGNEEDTQYYADLLTVGDFSSEKNQVMFQAMVNVFRRGDALDQAAVMAESGAVRKDLKLKTQVYPVDLQALGGDMRRAKVYAHTVKKMSWLRAAEEYNSWFAQKLTERPNPDELFAEAQERISVLQPPTKSGRFVYGWDVTGAREAEIAQRVADAKDGRVNPYTWPWSSWRPMVRPLRAGQVGIVAAQAGMGKSTVLDIVAEHWAMSGLHVVLVHLEDDLEYKLDRRDARWAQVELAHIEDGTLTPEEQERLADAHRRQEMALRTLHHFDAAGMDMDSIIIELNARVDEGTCQAVVFDYLDKTQASRMQAKLFGDQIWERQANDIEKLKTFAERAKVPVLAANQLNKGADHAGAKGGRRAHIQGSGQKLHKAQLVMILNRPEVEGGDLKDEEGTVLAKEGEFSPFIDWRIEKQNRGKTGNGPRQFLIGKHFDIVDVEQVPLEY